MNLPNLITGARVALTPAIAYLLLQPSLDARLAAFVLFLLAALSDLWDGHLARSRDEVTAFGKIVDPLADKLLLAATLVPLYLLTVRDAALAGLPLFGTIPLWVVVVLLGREILVTALRFAAARRGRIVSARRLGKRKALAQNVFVGAAMLWVTFRTAGYGGGGGLGGAFRSFHGWFTTSVLVLALGLTVFSLVIYLGAFTRIFAGKPS